jgi:ABC-type spermidine/putrescine transport system permease subunit II
MTLYSFNSSSLAFRWEAFSLRWYEKIFQQPEVLMAIGQSLFIATTSALGALVLGTLLALGLERGSRSLARWSEGLAYVPLLLPEIVLGLGLLVFFSRWLRPALAPLHLELDSLTSVTLGHITLASSYVMVSLRAQLRHYDRATEWAAFDLGASRTDVLLRILLPQLTPALISGFLMAFALSLDDFYVSYFVSVGGSGFKTVPLYLWGLQGRSALTPELNAVAVIMLLISGLCIALAYAFSKDPPILGGRS